MTDISREAVEAAKIWLSRMNDCVLSRCNDCDGSERGISGLLDALLDRNDKLVDAAQQVIDEIEPHGHWHCIDALKDALEEE